MRQRLIKNELVIPSISGLCLIFLVLVWMNFIRQQRQDRHEVLAAVVERNTNLAIALKQYALSTISNLNAALQLISIQYEKDSSTFDINTVFAKEQLKNRFFEGAAIMSKGQFICTTPDFDIDAWKEVEKMNPRIPAKTHQGLFISTPAKGTGKQKAVLNVSRSVFVDQSNSAIAVIQIDPSVFTSFYDQANLLPKDIISLIAMDGTTYARRTGSIESNGEDISKSPLFIHIKHNPDSFYFAKDAIRGIPTYFSYRTIREYPMLATVGRAREDVLSAFLKRRARDLMYASLSSVLIILFSFFAILLLLHRKKTAIQQRRAEINYQRQLTQQIILAQDREREIIGHELHDNVNQMLTSVKLYLELIAQDKQLHGHLASQGASLANAAISEIRNLSHRLSAPTLGNGSLVDSIQSLTDTVASSAGISVTFDHASYTTPLPMEQQLALYRIIQEQFNNIVKHSSATEVSLSLGQDGNNTVLLITDNGKGFDYMTTTSGIGLKNMVTRADLLNGTVDITTAPGQGCTVRVAIPK